MIYNLLLLLNNLLIFGRETTDLKLKHLLPKKINKETIIDSIVELRFISDLPRSVIFGVIYNELKDEFPEVEATPLSTVPENVRDNNPNFSFQALYKVKNENFVIQIGSDMIAISAYPKYLGWEAFSETCKRILNTVYKLGIIKQVLRIGIRYINKFDGNISNNVNVNLQVYNITGEVGVANVIFQVNHSGQNFVSRVQYSLESMRTVAGQDNLVTIIDIDTSTTDLVNLSMDNIWNKIEVGHYLEKQTFFELLKDDFIKTLEPSY